MGWRLGGKGASGRNLDPAYHARIEEHGVHMWSGLYENAFRMIREVYAELGRPPDAPLATWTDAFKPHDVIALAEPWKGEWLPWVLRVPTNGEQPGDAGNDLLPSLYAVATEAVRFIVQAIQEARNPTGTWLSDKTGEPVAPIDQSHPSALGRAIEEVLVFLAEGTAILLRPVWELLLAGLRALLGLVWEVVKGRLDDTGTRRMWILINFAFGNLYGAVADNVLEKGFDGLDGLDYAEWLSKYLVDDGGLTRGSPWMQFLYDAEFAYDGGDVSKPNLAAGVALRTLVRMGLTWKGALIWKMQAGMGDTIFAPMYLALKKRGVKFEFFTRVEKLELSADGKRVEKVHLGRQAQLAAPYDPLVEVKGLPCWPSTTLWDQVSLPLDHSINFEDPASPLLSSYAITQGVEFDAVVLGMPIGTLPKVAGELIAASPRWAEMVAQVKTVQTQALQLWLKPTAYSLGWKRMGRPLLATFHASPLNTWADMSHLNDREAFPFQAGRFPLNLSYFCGPLQDSVDPVATNAAVVKSLLNSEIGWLWPDAVQGNSTSPLKWDLLVDDRPVPGVGEDRVQAQYLRANYWPSERFTLSQAGKIRFRMAPGDTGFENLAIAGDWTDNGFNIGNVEATAMSGMLASLAVNQWPPRSSIVGVDFGH
jgi:uncharacterized protein with NAD-binding domain and iron-sulfur cluster